MKKLIYLLVFVFMACEHAEIIVDNLNQNDANEIIVVLQDHHINSKKVAVSGRKNTSYQISVAKKDQVHALRVLVNNQLPKNFRAGLKEVYPPGSAGLIPTKSDELARLTMALQGEIEGLLRVLPGIVDARVMLSGEKAKSASAALIFRNLQNQAPMSITEIQNLVASAVGDMNPQQVQVVMKELPILAPPKILDVDQAKATPNYLIWLLLSLSMIALLLAAYAFWRPRLMQA